MAGRRAGLAGVRIRRRDGTMAASMEKARAAQQLKRLQRLAEQTNTPRLAPVEVHQPIERATVEPTLEHQADLTTALNRAHQNNQSGLIKHSTLLGRLTY